VPPRPRAHRYKVFPPSPPQDTTRYTAWKVNLDDLVKYNQGSTITDFRGLHEYRWVGGKREGGSSSEGSAAEKASCSPPLPDPSIALCAPSTPSPACSSLPPASVPSCSDYSFTDFAAKRLMKNVNKARAGLTSASAPVSRRSSRKLAQTVPNEWDWRTGGKVPPVRDQGSCGSCWAFAAIGALESKALIEGKGSSFNVSEQQLVDCVNSANGYGSAGCNGGYSGERGAGGQRMVGFCGKRWWQAAAQLNGC
jgi:hypothetical protein